MLEQIYMAMKINGTLRAVDEKKYGLYGKHGYTDSVSKSASSCRHKCHLHQHTGLETRYEPWTNHSSQFCLKASKVMRYSLVTDCSLRPNLIKCAVSFVSVAG